MLILRTRRPIPEVGALAQDLILIDPYDPDSPVSLYRPLPQDALVTILGRLDEMDVLSGDAPNTPPSEAEDGGHSTLVRSLRRHGLLV
jgi:hypothetical protein